MIRDSSYRKNARLWFVILILGIVAAAVLYRYWEIATGGGVPTTAMMERQVERGRIFDRNGVLLAVDTPIYDILVWKQYIDRDVFAEHAAGLGSILGMSRAEVLDRWDSGGKNFFYIKKRTIPGVVKSLEGWLENIRSGPQDGSGQDLRNNASTRFVQSVKIEEVSGRLYPEGRLASHLVGFVGSQNLGLEGVEYKYDEFLYPSGTDESSGVTTDEGDSRSRGKDIVLTIDADLQFQIEKIARKAWTEKGAEVVMILVQDVNSGEMLSYAAMPDFDPNNYTASSPEARKDYPVTYTYEPGSVFKVYSLSSVLDLGAITENTTFECNGAYTKVTPTGEKIVIKDLGVYGTLTLDGVLAHSSNVGTGLASDRVDAVDLYDRLRSYGFGSRTGIALSGEAPGNLREPQTWSARSKPTIVMGQEFMATAVQMINAASAVGNLGILMKPAAVKSVRNPDGSIVFENKPQPVRRVISEKSARIILKSMETVASMEGTGWRAKVNDVRMGVKTGTAQMYDPATGRYSDKDYIASTLALIPADKPRYAVYTVIIKPRGEQYLGGRIAAPVAKEASDAVISIMDIPRTNTPEVRHSGAVRLPPLVAPEIGSVMPDLAGIPKRAFLPLLDRKDITFVMSGEGYMYKQNPPPGAAVPEGTTILLEFR